MDPVEKFLGPNRKHKVIYTDNSLEFRQSLWRSFLETLYVDTTQIGNKWDCLEERYAEWKKVPLQYYCSQVWMTIGGLIPWMLYLSAKRYRLLVWWEDALWKTFWETIWRTEHSIWFIGWVSPYNCEGSVTNPSIWKESFTWIVPRIRSVRGRVTYWSQTLRSWNRWTYWKSTRKDSMRKRWYFPNKENLFFQSQLGESKPLEEITSTLVRHRPIQGESNIDFLGESEGSPLPQPQDSFPDAGEAMNDFWSMWGNFKNRHHVEPRVKLYSPREEALCIPLKYIDVSRTTHTNLDVKHEKRIDVYWNIDGSRDLSDPWTGFTQVALLEEKPSRRIYVVWEEINEKTAYPGGRQIVFELSFCRPE